jgi:hypothetical protein
MPIGRFLGLPFFLKNAETCLSRMRLFAVLWMPLERMKELFGIVHIGEEEVPNVKRMCIGEEDISLS